MPGENGWSSMGHYGDILETFPWASCPDAQVAQRSSTGAVSTRLQGDYGNLLKQPRPMQSSIRRQLFVRALAMQASSL